jgi:hypothetical protein
MRERDDAELYGYVPGDDYTRPLRKFERLELESLEGLGLAPMGVKDARLRLAWGLLADDVGRIAHRIGEASGQADVMASACDLRRLLGRLSEHLRRLEDVGRACEGRPPLPTWRAGGRSRTSDSPD